MWWYAAGRACQQLPGLRNAAEMLLYELPTLARHNLSKLEDRMMPAANKLGFHRALYYSEEQGLLEKFRPYAPPADAWWADLRRRLAVRSTTAGSIRWTVGRSWPSTGSENRSSSTARIRATTRRC